MYLRLALLIICLGCLFSCHHKYDPIPDPNITFEATLNGASEVPANSSLAHGTATATYNTSSKILSVTITYVGISPTYGHLHKGNTTENGVILFPFPAVASPIYYSCPALDAQLETDLYDNLFYINLHTTAYPGGEIRGQLIRQ